MSDSTGRMPLIDAFKAVASQLIVFHHFAAYGPLSVAARQLAPATVDWLYDYARMAVQVFLVIAGFLAVRGLSASGQALAGSPLPLIGKRYLRLVIPFLAAIALAILCAALARPWLNDEMIPAPPTVGQLLAHALLLQSLLDFDSLSAGLWYVAIDFQLFALLAILLWLGRYTGGAPILVLALATAALFWFNRDESLDNWALYFFGSYGLGAAAWWASDRKQPAIWLGIIAGVTIAALVLDFRLRIALGPGGRAAPRLQPAQRPAGKVAAIDSARLPRQDFLLGIPGALPDLSGGQCAVRAFRPDDARRRAFDHFCGVDREHRGRHAVPSLDRRPGRQPAHSPGRSAGLLGKAPG